MSLLIIGFTLSNLFNPAPKDAMANNIPRTVMAHLIVTGLGSAPAETLIEEKPLSPQALQAEREKQIYQPDISTRSGLPWIDYGASEKNLPIFNNTNDLVYKPIIITGSGTIFSNKPNTSPIKRSAIIYYTVQSGDTVSAVARRFKISVNTILWANNLGAYSLIKPGDQLTILPESGILYKVRSGDTISGLSSQYQVKGSAILAANNLGDGLKIGQTIIIPGASPIIHRVTRTTTRSSHYTGLSAIHDLIKTPPASTASASRSGLIWPTVGHVITQYFSWHHGGVDIANRIGTPIYAARSGTVLIARGGWNGGYGNTILLDNGGGIRTRYGHASKLLVHPGQHVTRGQVIALMGSTGNSTGPHLHFEVLVNGVRRNPLNYIR